MLSMATFRDFMGQGSRQYTHTAHAGKGWGESQKRRGLSATTELVARDLRKYGGGISRALNLGIAQVGAPLL